MFVFMGSYKTHQRLAPYGMWYGTLCLCDMRDEPRAYIPALLSTNHISLAGPALQITETVAKALWEGAGVNF